MSVDEIVLAIDVEIRKLQQVRDHLSEDAHSSHTPVKRGPGRPKKVTVAIKTPAKRPMSAEARARIAAAQKKRWAAARKSGRA